MSRLDEIYKKAPPWLQTVLFNAYAARIHVHRHGPRLRSAVRELGDGNSGPSLVEYQNVRLRAVVKTAYENTRYYREVMDNLRLKPEDIRQVADLHKLPILEKETIKERGADLMVTGTSRRGWLHGHTSGTTGSPLSLWYDRKTCVMTNAVDRRQKHWAGMEDGDWLGVLLGRMIVDPHRSTPPFWQRDLLHKTVWFSSFHLNSANLEFYIETIRARKIRFLEGYPSTLYILARYLLERGDELPLKAVFTSSETLHVIQREAIQRAFRCRIFDFYGHAERVIFASECPEHAGKHLAERFGITEIVDHDGAVVEPGRFGYLVGTSLHNEAMPLIRYRTSDISAFREGDCPCGRTERRIENIATKAEDIIITPEGRPISPSVLTHPFKPFDQIEKSQIVQDRRDRVVVKVVVTAEFSKTCEAQLREALQERLGAAMTIVIERCGEIPRERSGKFRWVVSLISHGYQMRWDSLDEAGSGAHATEKSEAPNLIS